jgi:transcriptional regulator with XRE-family HTH domain
MDETTDSSRTKGSGAGREETRHEPPAVPASREAAPSPGSASRMRQVGLALKLARERCDLSQADVAAALGVSQSGVSGWEKATSPPSVDRLLQLADLYRQDLGEFGRTLQLVDGRPGGPRPEVDRPPPPPADFARRLLGRPPGELPVDKAESALTGMLELIYELAERLRGHR